MSAHIVVDVGNTRVKFGLCSKSAVVDSAASTHEPAEWTRHLAHWSDQLDEPTHFTIAGVVPKTVAALQAWVETRGDKCLVLASHSQVPVTTYLDHPEQAGIDRLLGALAARELFPGKDVLVVDAGSAITVNWVEHGVFRGGAILPGLRLMAKALHDHTAQLPQVDLKALGKFPGRDTISAINCGLEAAACGAIEYLAKAIKLDAIVLTGGDAKLLDSHLHLPNKHVLPWLTLEGVRIASGYVP